MSRPKTRGLIWSPDDEAALRKWRRVVCILYGCIGLVLVAAWGVHRLAHGGDQDKARLVGSSAPSPASIVPAGPR
jgi:flagellar biogenesis protein FliO